MATLLTEGVAVRANFLDGRGLRALAACAADRWERGEFHSAKIGTGDAVAHHPGIRGDSICWLTEPRAAPERVLFDEIEALRGRLNQAATLGLFEVEFQYARYPQGACYVRHLDQPRGKGQRQVSLVLYLNEDWPAGAGGELRIYRPGAAPLDIPPIGGSLVCFLTEGCEHEVLPATRTRWSLGGWLRTRG